MSDFSKSVLDLVGRAKPRVTNSGLVVATGGTRVLVRMDGRQGLVDNLSGTTLQPGDRVELARSRKGWSITGVTQRGLAMGNIQRNKDLKMNAETEDAALYSDTINAAAVGSVLSVSDTLGFSVGNNLSRCLVSGTLRLNPTSTGGNIQFTYYFVLDDGMQKGPEVVMRYIPSGANDYGVFPFTSIFTGVSAGEHTCEMRASITAATGGTVAVASVYALMALEL